MQVFLCLLLISFVFLSPPLQADKVKTQSVSFSTADGGTIEADLYGNGEQAVVLAHGAIFIKNGFKSYLGKKTSKIIIDQAIKTVIDGNIWIYPQLMNFIIQNIHIDKKEKSSSEVLDNLSQKEQNVANLVAQGYPNKDIAQDLGIQLVTVKKHISSIFIKLNIKDRVALAILINS